MQLVSKGTGGGLSRTAVAGLSVLALVATAVSVGTADAASSAETLEIASVDAPDDRTIEITFDRPLERRIVELTSANPQYLRHYLRIDGDDTLDGRPLAEVSGTSVHAVDVPADDRLRIVLRDSTLTDTDYQLWFDGDGHLLGDELFLRGADGSALPGTETAPIGFAGTTTAATTATIADASADNARVVTVTFEQSLLSGMPRSTYGGTGIALQGPDGAVHPSDVQPVVGTDDRVWRLYLPEDLEPGATYELRIDGAQHGLTTAAGSIGSGDVVTAELVGSDVGFGPPTIVSAEVDDDRDELVLRFDRRIAVVEGAEEPIEVTETPGGVSGVVLTDDDVRAILDLDMTVNANPRTRGEGVQAPAEDHLADIAAHLPDRETMVVRLRDGHHFRRAATGTVALRAGAVTDVTGLDSVASSGTTFEVPDVRIALPPSTAPGQGRDYLEIDRDATVEFLQNEFSFTDPPSDYSVRQENVHDRLVNEEIPAIVVENRYIEATFVPEYGARMLSLIYKPTGHDLLYTNPVGVPYGFTSTPPGRRGNSPFYHNWLMVWGGVFPTVTEAEHGKYWFLPWDYEITETADEIAISMSITDDLHYADRPGAYNYGATGIETEVVYRVSKDRPSVDMDVNLHNPTSSAKQYEYWVSTTLAPGEVSTEGSPTMEVLSNVETVQRIGWSPWMSQVEEPAPGTRMLYLDKLNRIVNWSDLGIAYGQDLDTLPQADWWGVVNHENSEGVIRVSDNTITHGLKFWMWGHDLSFDTSIYQRFGTNHPSSRPYIELWGGTSEEFFAPDVLAAGETKSWTETYLPTMGLADVTNANAEGAANLRFVESDDGLEVVGQVFSTRIGQQLRATLVDVSTGRLLARTNFAGDPHQPARFTADVQPGSTVRLVLSSVSGRDVYLTAEKTHG